MDWTQFFSVLAAALTVSAFFIGAIRWLINTSQAYLHRDIGDIRKDIAEMRIEIKDMGRRIDEQGRRIDDQGRRIDHLYEVMMEIIRRDLKPKDV